MPKKVLTVTNTGDLVLEWSGMFRNMTVTFAGQELGRFVDKAEVKRGRAFTLPDGRTLHVQFQQTYGNTGLVTSIDGVPLAGTHSHPETQIKAAYGVVFFVAGLNLLIGLLAAAAHVDMLQRMGFGWQSFGAGILFLGLGVGVWRGRSRVALILAIAIFALDGILTIYYSMAALGAGQTPGLGGIFMRVALIVPMITGVGALGRAKKLAATQPPTAIALKP